MSHIKYFHQDLNNQNPLKMPSDSKKKEMQRKKDARNKKVNGASNSKKDDKDLTNGSSEPKELTVSLDDHNDDLHNIKYFLLGRRIALSEVR